MTRQASGNTFNVQSDLAKFLNAIVIDFDADGEEENDDKGGDGASGSDGASGDGDEGGEGAEGASGSDGTIKDPEKKRLSDEAAAHRNRAKTEKERADKAEAELRKITDKDKSELELKTREAAEATERATKAEARALEMSVELAFFKSGVAGRLEDPSDALRLLDLDDIKPDDDGKVDTKAIQTRVEDLLKKKPYLARKSDGDDGGAGQNGGSPNNGRRKTKDEASAAKLKEKYPALASRV